MRQIGENLWAFWSAADQDGIDRNGFLLHHDGCRIAIDPPGCADEDSVTFLHLGAPTDVILTSDDRLAAGADFARRFGSALWLPQLAAEAGARRYLPETTLPGGLLARTLPTPLRAGEVALLIPSHRALVIGASFRAVPAGRVKGSGGLAAEAIRDNVQALAAIDFELLLPNYGFILAQGGRQALRAAA